MNLKTGEVRTSELYEQLDINHISAVLTKQVDSDAYEIWMSCGFRGSKLDEEHSITNSLILRQNMSSIDIVNGWLSEPIEGPHLPVEEATGACAALALPIDGPDEPEHICRFAGSIGKHDHGVFQNTVSCFNRRTNEFIKLPSLPSVADHLNVIRIPKGVCNKDDDSKLIAFNFRNASYGKEVRDMYELALIEKETDGSLSWRNWKLMNVTSEFDYSADAAGVIIR